MKDILLKKAVKAKIFKDKVMSVLKDNSGQGSVETAIQILVAVVLGALILVCIFAYMNMTHLQLQPNQF